MTEESFLWGFLIVIIIFDLLFAAVKAAFTYTRLPFLLNHQDKEDAALGKAIKVMERPRVRTSLRLALLFTHLFTAGVLVLILKSLLLQPLWAFLLSLVATLFILAILEYLIEGVVLKDPERAVMQLSGFALLLDFFFMPLAWITTTLLGKKASIVTLDSFTEEELRNWVEEGQAEGSLEREERQMIYSIFQFADTFAREIMVPRIDVLALDVTSTIGEARQAFQDAGHSRVPVYEDTIDNVVGLLYAKDLLSVQDDSLTLDSQRQILRDAYFVPEAKKVDDLLAEMQSKGIHMALVVDEYGGVAGVVTLEDIVEEIVGEIRDEYDEKEEVPYQQINENEYRFSGRISLDDFNDMMGTTILANNTDSLGGYIYGMLGHVPAPGEEIVADGVTLKIEEVIGRRILKVFTTRTRKDNHTAGDHHAERE